MSKPGRVNDAAHMYMSELTSRVVATSGTPSDRFHLGKIFLKSFRDDPEFVLQIDGATGEHETFSSILERSVQCANCFKNLGLGVGDVIVLMAPNHIDNCVPFYAAAFLGIIVSAIDRTLNVGELQATFQVSRPKIIFCQRDRAQDVQLSLNELDLDSRIISFDGGDYLCSFQQLLEKYGQGASIEEFEPTDFDPEETIGYLIATSGTTGLPKLAAATVKNFAVNAPYIWLRYTQFPRPTRLAMVMAPLQWLTALLTYIAGPIFRFPRLQTSQAMTQGHFCYLLNKYKPSWFVTSPTLMTSLIKAADRSECDFSCLDTVLLGGSAVSADLIEDIREVSPTTEAFNAFGMSELTGVAFINSNHNVAWACGQPIGCLQYRAQAFELELRLGLHHAASEASADEADDAQNFRGALLGPAQRRDGALLLVQQLGCTSSTYVRQIIDCESGKDITEPNKPGELWLKGPGVFKGYYRNDAATEETFAEGRWLKTGDMFYFDENDNFYFVERIKLLLKYMSNQISPFELEDVIRRHPGVLDAAVTGIPDPECGDLPVACVVRSQGSTVTAEEIKQLVRESLADSKQLRGGVIFVDAIPQTASTKVHRRHLKEMAMTMEKE